MKKIAVISDYWFDRTENTGVVDINLPAGMGFEAMTFDMEVMPMTPRQWDHLLIPLFEAYFLTKGYIIKRLEQ